MISNDEAGGNALQETYDQRGYRLDRIAQLPLAVVDHDDDTVTIAVTFHWRRPWALDQCEAGNLVGSVRRVLEAHFGDPEWVQLAGIDDVVCFEPNEERMLGRHNLHPVATTFTREDT